jgi:hypothetical protein
MKRVAITLALLAALFMIDPLCAQEKSGETTNSSVSGLEGPQARVQVIFTEYEGQKKVQSLPYTLLVRVGANGKDGPLSKIRMGSRVPIATGTTQFQYVDVGTDVDCAATMTNDGRYQLSLRMERSWPEFEGSSEPKSLPATSEARVGGVQQPVIRQFRSDNSIILREGQTVETNLATDPVTGKVVKIEVSLSLVK